MCCRFSDQYKTCSRSNCPEVFCEKDVLEIFVKFTGKCRCENSLRPATLLKKRLQHRFFTVNFVKFLRTPFLHNTSRRLHLKHAHHSQFFPIYGSTRVRPQTSVSLIGVIRMVDRAMNLQHSILYMLCQVSNLSRFNLSNFSFTMAFKGVESQKKQLLRNRMFSQTF